MSGYRGFWRTIVSTSQMNQTHNVAGGSWRQSHAGPGERERSEGKTLKGGEGGGGEGGGGSMSI